MNVLADFAREALQQPVPVVVWMAWLIVVNTACLAFLRHPEGRLTLIAFLGNLPTMTLLYLGFGYVRLLGLSHLIWWSPLLLLLWWRRPWARDGAFGIWLRLLFVTNAVSWVIDLVDVVRYMLGDRG